MICKEEYISFEQVFYVFSFFFFDGSTFRVENLF